ncbi:hypothetical protein CAEBREN_31631 [Caenorhabditis brenneri]|uniref:Innexin n=1 Tax=Caenorhabditis brenneri TaxID=135651 RepID=G0PHP3_CAEBE|nr:hypothetical protein CAEBREN_31631 [Caenorhabditis brenneri]
MDSNDANYKVDARDTIRWLEHKKRDRWGMHTTMLMYVLMKWMTFLSLLLQFYMMAKIYASGELLWGVHISYELLNGAYKNLYTGVFPQIVGCKTHRTQIGGNVNEFAMRCILPQNFVNSKVFLFLYWWYILAMFVSIFSAIQFTAMLMLPRYQRYATKSLLPTLEYFVNNAGNDGISVIHQHVDPLEHFVDYMGNDGYLLLQCASVPLSVVRIRSFLNSLYEIVIPKQSDHIQKHKVGKKELRSKIEDIDFDGSADCHKKKNNFKKQETMMMTDRDSFSGPLIPHSSCESYYIKRYGGPHPDLHMTTANPIDHLIDYLGNDGFLIVRMVYDMLHHYACDRLIDYVWVHEISRCDEKILIEVRKKSKIVDNSVVIDTEMDGGGDRHRGGYDHPEKKKLLSSVEPNDSVSCAKFSLSRESQPSLMLSESDEEPLLSPTLFNSLS